MTFIDYILGVDVTAAQRKAAKAQAAQALDEMRRKNRDDIYAALRRGPPPLPSVLDEYRRCAWCGGSKLVALLSCEGCGAS